MSYNPRPMQGEIVVVPLGHPNGAYIRLEDNQRIPVLARVRAGFSETVNVINFFGYVYNVPVSHIERINHNIDTNFYVHMIENAQRVLNSFGYQSLDNTGFYDTSYGSNSSSYSFLSHLPGFSASSHSNVIAPNLMNQGLLYQTDYPNPPRIITTTETRILGNNIMRSDDLGSVSVMGIDGLAILHVINTMGRDQILFDKRSGVLLIPGYGTFIVDTSFTYTKTGSTVEFVIMRSQKNYIHIRRSNVHYRVVKDNDIDRWRDTESQYETYIVRPKTEKPRHKRYFDIMRVIDLEFT
jgi:hypothetical protein